MDNSLDKTTIWGKLGWALLYIASDPLTSIYIYIYIYVKHEYVNEDTGNHSTHVI